MTKPSATGSGNASVADFHDWNEKIAALPGAHLLQTREWAELKAPVGWKALPYFWHDHQGRVNAAAVILQRHIPIGGFAARLGVMYVPRGPMLDWHDPVLRGQVLDDLRSLAKKSGAIFIKIDPDIAIGWGISGRSDEQDEALGVDVIDDLRRRGWHLSDEQVQFRNTVLLDLNPDLPVLLAAMKEKTRYNIRLAGRRGVIVRTGGKGDLDLLYRMYAATATRDSFVIRERDYYLRLWSTMIDAGMGEPLIAEVEGEPVAGIVVLRFAGRGYYMHGMSIEAHREKMPNHLLQWTAIQRLKEQGCRVYDLWGAPDVFDENDRMWGVYRFKEGLGGRVMRGLGAWDLPLRSVYYRLYTQILPRLLEVMRRQRREQTRLEM